LGTLDGAVELGSLGREHEQVEALRQRLRFELRRYKGLASLDGLIYRPLDSVEASGDPGNAYSEAVRAGDVDVRASREATSEPSRYPLR
jgi:hypothetical protein